MHNKRRTTSSTLSHASNHRPDVGDRHARYLDASLPQIQESHPHHIIYTDIYLLRSLIEANLVIITGCLPTMRLFFRHVAPRLIGESSLRSRSRKQSSTGYGGGSHHQLELKTIGSRAMNKRFEYVEDDTVSVGSEERTTAGWRGDRDSERGIVVAGNAGGITKTSSVVVESELRKSSSTDLRSSVACLR
jgi:hypothetical protein